MFVARTQKIGRNAPCPCGSGKKYKKCCLLAEQAEQAKSSVGDRLAELLEKGYTLSQEGHCTRACDAWTELWRSVVALMRPEMRKCRHVDAIFPDIQFFGNWADDFVIELLNGSRIDLRYATTGIEVCEHLMVQLPDEATLFQQNLRADLGELYFRADRAADGERLFQELIRDYPDAAIGYVRLADALQERSTPSDEDYRRAEALLRQALPLPDAANFDVEARLGSLSARA